MTSGPTDQLIVLGYTVRRDGQVVASLWFSGWAVTVHPPLDCEPDDLSRPLGRLYRTSRYGDRYDVWTAKHPYAPTPSDERLAESLPLNEGIGLLLERAGESNRKESS